jgi:uncharacterized protein YwqG
MIDWVSLLVTVGFMTVLIGLLQWREVRSAWQWWKERRERAESIHTFRAEYEAANPAGPPITPEEHAAFCAWLAAQARPALRLTPAPGPAEPDGCRIGGPVWLAEGQAWPLSPQGERMEFLAQLDFAALPPLPGFPRAGLVQMFLPADDDLMGMDPDDPSASTVVVLTRANGAGAVRAANIADGPDICSPFKDDRTRQHGVPLTPTPFTAAIDMSQWQAEEQREGKSRREGIDQWDDLLFAPLDDAAYAHHVGGHPAFVQADFRRRGQLDDYDCCLLRLTSDTHLQWGDVGEANWLIRPEDLARGDFSRVIFWWDCS